MLQVILIGNLGGNAEVKAADGREFVTFRVAHNEGCTDANGQKIDRTMWVDCTMSCQSGRPAVLPYLVAGTMVCVIGSMTTRIYSSEKDRCMKAGVKVHVQRIELLGGSGDVIPRRLYDNNGVMLDVTKFYHVDQSNTVLRDIRGREFTVDANGWVRVQQLQRTQPSQNDTAQNNVTNNNQNADNNGQAPY